MMITSCSRIIPRMLAVFFVFLAANTARADVRYYLLIFSAQTHPKIPRRTHTFCTLVKVGDPLPDCSAPCVEAYTISWLPATLKVKPFRRYDEPGYNLKLDETLRWAAQNRMQVKEWGPFAITEDFYLRVFQEYMRFESGGYRYKAIDPAYRDSRTSDCIHAVTDVDQRDPRTTYSVINCGDRVTYKFVVILRERGRLQLPPDNVSWIDAALGLSCWPIVHCPPP